MLNLAARRASEFPVNVIDTRRSGADYNVSEFEGSNVTRHDPPVGDVLRQVAHAMDTVSGAQAQVLACLTDSVSGKLPKALILKPLLEIRWNMNAARPPF
jgi:hypothetical protein